MPNISTGSTVPGIPSDEELLVRAARGEREAFTHLVASTRGPVYRLALAITGNTADAEDVLQETYLAAYRGAASFRGDASARTWLLTIARHHAWRIGKRRVQGAEPPSGWDAENLESLGLAAGWGSDDPERIATRAQDRDMLLRAMARLPEDYREIISLRDLEGIAGDAVAHLMGLALPAMKSRLHRARLALAACLREEGYHA
jgi:RNA polymerase sigma-70 factor, ECF subfamily